MWYLDESKEPKSQPTKISSNLESVIIQTRHKLVKRDEPHTRYAYHGAIAIHQKLDEMGYKDKPHISTINRVLKRNNLIEQKESLADPNKPKIYYPVIPAQYPGHIYESDLVTPRFISGYGPIVSVNRVDVYSGQANLDQYTSKGADSIIEFATEDWKIYPKPTFFKLDNEASFRGSMYHPRTFGKLTRFCLNFGVQIIFIPFNEPWRNPYIESFNSRFNELLWLSRKFKNLDDIKRESKHFRDQHNNFQVYKKRYFSKQRHKSFTTSRFPSNFVFEPSNELPITRGKLHFIRLVNEKGHISILNEPFYVNKDLCFEYVWATIDTGNQKLYMYYRPAEHLPRALIKTFEYKLREPIKNRIPVKQFCKV